jgi:hypothetical protein
VRRRSGQSSWVAPVSIGGGLIAILVIRFVILLAHLESSSLAIEQLLTVLLALGIVGLIYSLVLLVFTRKPLMLYDLVLERNGNANIYLVGKTPPFVRQMERLTGSGLDHSLTNYYLAMTIDKDRIDLFELRGRALERVSWFQIAKPAAVKWGSATQGSSRYQLAIVDVEVEGQIVALTLLLASVTKRHMVRYLKGGQLAAFASSWTESTLSSHE